MPDSLPKRIYHELFKGSYNHSAILLLATLQPTILIPRQIQVPLSLSAGGKEEGHNARHPPVPVVHAEAISRETCKGSNSDNQSTAQTSTREDPMPRSQLMDGSLNDGSSRTPAIMPTAVPLIAPNPPHQTNDTHSSGTEAVLPHARK